MLKNIFKDSAIYGIGTFITSFINLLFLPLLTRLLTVNEFGVISLVASLTSIVNYLVTLNITQSTSRFVVRAETIEEKRLYASSGFWFICLAYLLCLLILSGGFRFLSIPLVGVDDFILYLTALLCIIFSGIFTYMNSQLRWLLKPHAFVKASILMVVSSVVFTYVSIRFLQMGAMGYFLGLCLGYALGGLYAYTHVYTLFSFQFSREKLKQMLVFSTPLALSSVMSYFYLAIDKWAIRILLNFHDLGIYGVASRLASIGPAAIGVLSLGLLPYIYSSYQKPEFPKTISFLFRLTLWAAFSGALFFLVFQHGLMSLIAGKNFLEAGAYVPLLFMGVVLTSFYDFTPGAWIYGKTIRIAVVNVVTGVVNTALNFLLIPHFGLWGSVIAMLISGGIVFGGNVLMSQSLYKVPYSWIRVFFASLVFCGCYTVLNQVKLSCLSKLFISLCAIGFMGMILLFSKDLLMRLLEYAKRTEQRKVAKESLGWLQKGAVLGLRLARSVAHPFKMRAPFHQVAAYYLCESLVVKLNPCASDHALPLPDDLIIAPGYYVYEGATYDIRWSGVYRFMQYDQKNEQRVVYQLEADILTLLASLAALHNHGNEDDGKTNLRCYELAKSRKLNLSCQDMAVFSHFILQKLKLESRVVATMTLEELNGDDGHYMIEVYCPIRKKWLLCDLDLGFCFKKQDEFLSLDEFLQHVSAGNYDFYPLTQYPAVDMGGFRAKNGYRYDFLVEAMFGDLKTWYKRVAGKRQV